jgi:hypothetical protein
MALVIKQWNASETPDSSGEYVRIHGREAGLINFLLSFLGIDPTTTLAVDGKSVRLEKGSLAGFARSVTPLTRVASASYGYFKPWKKAVIIAALAILVMSIPVIGWVVGILLLLYAPLHYFLNKDLFLEVVNNSGIRTIYIVFKRSVIEGQSIDENAGEKIVGIVEMLLLGLDAPRAMRPTTSGTSSNLDDMGSQIRQRMDEVRTQATRAGGIATAKVAASLATASENMSHAANIPESKCPGCGASITAEDAFCGGCGRTLR